MKIISKNCVTFRLGMTTAAGAEEVEANWGGTIEASDFLGGKWWKCGWN